MESTEEVAERWEALVADSRQTVRETLEEINPDAVDIEGLLLLVEWLAGAAEDLSDEEAAGLRRVYDLPPDVEPEAIRLVLREVLYDDLWGILRTGGWLEG